MIYKKEKKVAKIKKGGAKQKNKCIEGKKLALNNSKIRR